MNERIKELIAQAGIHFHKGGTLDAGPNGIARFVLYSNLEKFAELIVKECLTFVEPMPGSGDIDDLALEGASNQIKAHFGVTE